MDRNANRTGLLRWARIGFVASAWLYALSVLVQVFLAGVSLFGEPQYWADHRSLGASVGVFPLLMALAALLGRLGWPAVVISVALILLHGLQFPFANAGSAFVAAFHPVNALVMFVLALWIAERIRPQLAAVRS
jgi:hypothetical protein